MRVYKLHIVYEGSCTNCPYLLFRTDLDVYHCNHFSFLNESQKLPKTRPGWCPEEILNRDTVFVRLPKDEVLADFLEDHGLSNISEELRKR